MADAAGSRLNIAIIGGGIAGISLAIGLLKHKHLDVQIYEMDSEFSEIGAGLTLGPNARRAMEMLGPSLIDAFETQRTGNLWPGRENYYMNHFVGYGPRAGEHICVPLCPGGQQSVHRGKFLDAMAKGVPASACNFNKALTSIGDDTSRENAPMTLHFSDGSRATADAVIGADGIRSLVRAHLLGASHPAAAPVFAGSVSYRRIVPMRAARAALGAEHADNSTILCGPGRAMLTYPLDGGAAVNIIAIDFTRRKWDHEEWRRPAPREELVELFRGWSRQAQNIVDLLTDGPGLTSWAMHETHAPYFARGRTALMGDAAHASTPYQGQGAAHAMEDATVLAAVLGRARQRTELPAALGAYDLARRARAQRVVATSRETGDLLAMQMPGVGADLGRMRAELARRFKWLWYRDLDRQCGAALEIMEESLTPDLPC